MAEGAFKGVGTRPSPVLATRARGFLAFSSNRKGVAGTSQWAARSFGETLECTHFSGMVGKYTFSTQMNCRVADLIKI